MVHVRWSEVVVVIEEKGSDTDWNRCMWCYFENMFHGSLLN
ncbi:hypothetical protein HanIR_Chr02g0082021 [Helianthus annuus]|nr:hypothetical protein HanIR_Chr02g0082021 [Helianthus annuus]